MLTIGNLYQTKRGNQTETAGILIKGDTASVTLYGSDSKPSVISDMVSLLDDGEVLTKGAYPIIVLPEYILVDGSADAVELVSAPHKDLGGL